MPAHYLVVPDSLAADAAGRPLARPSFVYRAVLDAAVSRARDTDTVTLAPGNRPEGAVSEEHAGYAYLNSAGCKGTLLCPGITLPPLPAAGGYIDTWRNAALLAPWVDLNLSYCLLVARLHADRAAWCFRRNGFRLGEVIAVAYAPTSEPIVRRHWYYRHPRTHALYERAAWLRDRLLH